jgi:hypothetical protein
MPWFHITFSRFANRPATGHVRPRESNTRLARLMASLKIRDKSLLCFALVIWINLQSYCRSIIFNGIEIRTVKSRHGEHSHVVRFSVLFDRPVRVGQENIR